MVRIALILLVALSRGAFGLDIRSGDATYTGKEILLTGQVDIQHELGRICAQRLRVSPASSKPFSFFELQDDVCIDSAESGQLRCQKAEIDYEQLKGKFWGQDMQPDAIYTYQKQGVVVKSPFMQVDLVRYYDTEAQAHKSLIQRIEAEPQVQVVYQQDTQIFADQACYERHETGEKLVLSMRTGKCQVHHREGDHLQAETITIDLNRRCLILERPEGVLAVHHPAKQAIHFSCALLTWEADRERLLLQKEVRLEGMGELKTDHDVEVQCNRVNGKRGIEYIQAQAETTLIYRDANTHLPHLICCPGPLMIDHAHLQMRMESGLEEGKQIYFEDLAGELYADRLELTYQWDHQTLVPEHLMMQGHVRILNRFDGHLQESSSVLHYALADRLDYSPKDKEMVLSSQPPQRVLLFDKMNHLQMSAPALKVWQQGNNPPSIQGMGDVRFTFIKKELEQLNIFNRED